MIDYNPKLWTRLIFQFHKTDSFRILLPSIIGVGVFCWVVAIIELEFLHLKYHSTTIIHSLLGFVLSMLLVFRTNTAYDRWWEGRKLWGSLLNNSRNLALKINPILPAGDPAREALGNLILLYPQALKEHLRNKKVHGHDLPAGVHQPNFIASRLFEEINQLVVTGKLSGEQLLFLNPELLSFTDICGACERIKKTPIPYAYSLFIKKFIFVYIITMPFSFVTEFRYSVIPIVMFVFYVLASLELIAEEIEDPFGKDANDLPTDAITESIRLSVLEIMKIPQQS
ncbi:MAG: bestrophin family ion channel [Bacteroidota bacterium]